MHQFAVLVASLCRAVDILLLNLNDTSSSVIRLDSEFNWLKSVEWFNLNREHGCTLRQLTQLKCSALSWKFLQMQERKSIFADLNSHYGNSIVAGDTVMLYMHIKCNVDWTVPNDAMTTKKYIVLLHLHHHHPLEAFAGPPFEMMDDDHQ